METNNVENLNRVTLITGATGGLGVEFSLLFAKSGHDLLLVGRNQKQLEAMQKSLMLSYDVNVYFYTIDFTGDRVAEKIMQYVTEEDLFVENLINNAGFGNFGFFADLDIEKETAMMQVNNTVLMQMCHTFLQPMLEHHEGRIMNVASIAAFQPGPLMATYYATKAFVLSFTEALAVELQGTGVSMTALCPGPTETGFEKNANLATSGLFKNLKVESAEKVAKKGYKEMMQKKVVVIPGMENKVIVTASKFAPRGMVRNMVQKIQE